MKRFLLVLKLLVCIHVAYSANISSKAGAGDWHNASTWVGEEVPKAWDDVTIVNGSTVTIAVKDSSVNNIQIAGILKFATGSIGFTVRGNCNIAAGGVFKADYNSVTVHGNFVNNGTAHFAVGASLTMAKPIVTQALSTSIEGAGSFNADAIRNLRISNPAGVALKCPVTIVASLTLLHGILDNQVVNSVNNLKLDNTTTASSAPAVTIIRYQTSSLSNPYVIGTDVTLNVQYKWNSSYAPELVVEGYELPVPTPVNINSLLIDNVKGVLINRDINLHAASDALQLRTGVLEIAPGKTLSCTSPIYSGVSGTVSSYVKGGIALSVGTSPVTRTFPVGSDRQSRTVIVEGLKSTSGTDQKVRFTIEENTGGTSPGNPIYNNKRWKGTVFGSGSVAFTGISLEYGPYDQVNMNGRVLRSTSTISGTYSVLTSAGNTSSRIKASGNYASVQPGSVILLGYFALGGSSLTYADQITSSTLLTPGVKRYEKAEWDISVSTAFVNPFKESEVAVDMLLTSPSSKQIKLPCFYFSGKGNSTTQWKARFMPQESGTYTYKFTLRKNGNPVPIYSTNNQSLVVAAAATGKNGILHLNGTGKWNLKYDSGTLFRGIGQNVGWDPLTHESSQAETYEKYLPLIKNNGANFFRVFMNYSNLPIEWNTSVLDKYSSRYQNSTEIYHQQGIERMDSLVSLADQLGLHMMLMIEWQMNLRADAKWPFNPYNAENGGPALTPTDFFTNAAAREQFKNRLRYLVARWGYSPSIGMWELMNEVDNAAYAVFKDVDGNGNDALAIQHAPITAWHAEMAAYLKQIDPYKHIVTTSISHRRIAGLYDVPDIDINQEHTYTRTDSIPRRTIKYTNTHNKPFVIGEYGYRWQSGDPAYWSEFNFHFKKGLWYGLFNPTPVMPVNWFWVLWDSQNGFPYFNKVKTIHEEMQTAGNGSYTVSAVATSPADTTLYKVGVKCGSKVFAYFLNRANYVQTRQAKIEVFEPNKIYGVEIYNPETGTRANTSYNYTSDANGIVTLGDLTWALNDHKIFILTPASTSSSTSFGAKPLNDHVKLNWQVFADRTTKNYEIQRSADGIDYLTIYKASGISAPSISNNFTTYDRAPLQGSNYYRLNQIDASGNVTEMGIRHVNFQSITIYKGSGNVVHVDIPAYTSEQVEIQIIDLSGREVLRQKAFNKGDGKFTIQPHQILSGIYLVKAAGKGIDKTEKIIF